MLDLRQTCRSNGLTDSADLFIRQMQFHILAFGIFLGEYAGGFRQDQIAAVMEAMSFYSYQIVRPAYYDSVLSLRFMQDPQSRDILGTMFETIAFDYAYVTGIGDVRGSLRSMLPAKKLAVASRAKGWERSINKLLEKDNAALDELP